MHYICPVCKPTAQAGQYLDAGLQEEPTSTSFHRPIFFPSFHLWQLVAVVVEFPTDQFTVPRDFLRHLQLKLPFLFYVTYQSRSRSFLVFQINNIGKKKFQDKSNIDYYLSVIPREENLEEYLEFRIWEQNVIFHYDFLLSSLRTGTLPNLIVKKRTIAFERWMYKLTELYHALT